MKVSIGMLEEDWENKWAVCLKKTPLISYLKEDPVSNNLKQFSHLANVFIQSDLQMRITEAIKINKRAMICKCYSKSQLA